MKRRVLVPCVSGIPWSGSPCARRAHSSHALSSHSAPSDDFSSWWYSQAFPVSTLIAVCATCCTAWSFLNDGRAVRLLRRTCVGVRTGGLVGVVRLLVVGAVVGRLFGWELGASWNLTLVRWSCGAGVGVGVGSGRVVGTGCGGGVTMVDGSSLVATGVDAVGTLGSGAGLFCGAVGAAIGAGGITLGGTMGAGVGGCVVGACCG
jgi:hypothetical protein